MNLKPVRHTVLIVFLGFIYLGSRPCYAQNQQEVRHILDSLKQKSEDSLDMAISEMEKWVQYAMRKGYLPEASLGYMRIGNLRYDQALYPEAYDVYLRGLDIRRSIGDSAGCASAKHNLARASSATGSYRKALNWISSSLNTANRLINPSNLPLYNNTLGNIYVDLGMLEEAMKVHQYVLEMRKKARDTCFIAESIVNVGVVFHQQDKFRQAIANYKESQSYLRSCPFPKLERILLENLGASYTNLGEIGKARELYGRAMRKSFQAGDSLGILNIHLGLGVMYEKEAKFDSSLYHYNHGLKLAIRLKEHSRKALLLKNIGDIYDSLGNYSDALIYLRNGNLIKDSLRIIDQKAQDTIALIEARRVTRLERQLLEQQKKIRGRAILGLIGLLILLGIISWYIFDRHQKQKIILLQKEELLESKEQLHGEIILDLTKQHLQEVTEEIISVQDEERNRISSELHEGVNTDLAAIGMNLDTIEPYFQNIQKGEILELFRMTRGQLKEACKSIRELSHQLNGHIVTDKGLELALQELCDNLAASGRFSIEFTHKGLGRTTFGSLPALHIYRIIQGVFQNIIRHAKAQNVKLKLEVEEELLFISVKDDGIGFVFHPDMLDSQNGLKNLASRVRLLKGKLEIDSAVGKGTTVNISNIPVHQDA